MAMFSGGCALLALLRRSGRGRGVEGGLGATKVREAGEQPNRTARPFRPKQPERHRLHDHDQPRGDVHRQKQNVKQVGVWT